MSALLAEVEYVTYRDRPIEACSTRDPDLLYDADETARRHPDHWLVQEAKQVCGSCYFRSQCLEGAIERKEKHGIWGGMTTLERQALDRRARRAGRQPETLPGM